jgi:hypothetical protein
MAVEEPSDAEERSPNLLWIYAAIGIRRWPALNLPKFTRSEVSPCCSRATTIDFG